MFGNRLGWGIAGVLAICVLGVVYMVASLAMKTTAPSAGALDKAGKYSLKLLERPQMLDPISLPFTPTAILPSMTKAEDAGPHYRAAIAEFMKDPHIYNPDNAARIKSTNLSDYPALKHLIEAKDCATMNLFAGTPEDVIKFSIVPEPIKALGSLGETAINVSMRMPDSQKEEALALSEAAFALGAKMAAERLRWSEFETGHQLIYKGCYRIAALDPARAPAANAAKDDMVKLIKERCMPFAFATTSIDPEVMGRTAGDIFYIVKNGKERMWRIEALLKLGQYKYNSGEPGNGADQRYAKSLARKVMNDPNEDKIIRAAAKASYELTKDDYMGIGAN